MLFILIGHLTLNTCYEDFGYKESTNLGFFTDSLNPSPRWTIDSNNQLGLSRKDSLEIFDINELWVTHIRDYDIISYLTLRQWICGSSSLYVVQLSYFLLMWDSNSLGFLRFIHVLSGFFYTHTHTCWFKEVNCFFSHFLAHQPPKPSLLEL